MFFGGGRGLNPRPCIYYALSLPTELNSRGLNYTPLKRKWKWSGLLKQESLFLLNMMSFIYAFVKSTNFISIKCKDLCWYFNVLILCFAKKKRKCMRWTFIFKFQLKIFTKFFILFFIINVIDGYLYKPADTSKYVDYPLNGYLCGYG